MAKSGKKLNQKQETNLRKAHARELKSVVETKGMAPLKFLHNPDKVRIPKYVGQLSELKKGDMLVFLSTSIFFQSVIRVMQSIFSLRKKGLQKGYNVFTHAGIIYDFDKDGNPMLAHVTEAPGKKGYVVESLSDMLERNEGRAFYVARLKDKKVADRIADEAKNAKKYNLKWSKKAAFKVGAKPNRFSPRTKPEEATIHVETICSQFVTDVLQVATKGKDARQYYPTELRSQSFPKTLFSYFASKPQFELLCHTGDESPYVLLCREIKTELDSMSHKITQMQEKNKNPSKLQRKYNDTTHAFADILNEIAEKKGYDELQKSYYLLQKLLPVLKKNVGLSLRDDASYKRIKALAERKGLFQEQIQAFGKDLKKGFNNRHIQHPPTYVHRGRGH